MPGLKLIHINKKGPGLREFTDYNDDGLGH